MTSSFHNESDYLYCGFWGGSRSKIVNIPRLETLFFMYT